MSDSNEIFKFSDENRIKADAYIARYPEGKQQSAVMPLLYLAQNQNSGWLSQAAIEYVADYLSMSSIKVFEVATFYTMYNLSPVGKNHIQLCRTTPCWLRGSNNISQAICEHLLIKNGETTHDGMFTLTEVECLGACVNAPVVQINDDFYEDLDVDSIKYIIDMIKESKKPIPGPQKKRQKSAPESGPKTLITSKEN